LISDQFFNSSFLDKFIASFQGGEQTRIIILGISVGIFLGVLRELYPRLNSLKNNAFTSFIYLVEREAIRIDVTKKEKKDSFDKSLQEIERYLNNGDWNLATMLVQRVNDEYNDFIRREWIDKK
jgi:hypothetical protein